MPLTLGASSTAETGIPPPTNRYYTHFANPYPVGMCCELEASQHCHGADMTVTVFQHPAAYFSFTHAALKGADYVLVQRSRHASSLSKPCHPITPLLLLPQRAWDLTLQSHARTCLCGQGWCRGDKDPSSCVYQLRTKHFQIIAYEIKTLVSSLWNTRSPETCTASDRGPVAAPLHPQRSA